jgi:hypothetical protein
MRSLFLSALVLVTSTFAAHSQTNVSFELKFDPSVYSYSPIVQGDFDRDGKLDIVYATDNSLMLRRGNGDGTFQAPTTIGAADAQVTEIQVADFDHDGLLDIVALTYQNTFDVFFGIGDGTFTAPVATAAASSGGMTIGDFNGDHLQDIAIGGHGSLQIFNDVSGRSFILKTTLTVQSNTLSMSLGAGDFENDGIQSIVAMTGLPSDTSAPPGTYIFWNDGNENFQKVELTTFATPTTVKIADLNQDGMADILLSYDCNSNNETPGKGDPTPCEGIVAFYGQGQHKLFQRTLLNTTSYPSSPNLEVADVNGDGIADLVISRTGGSYHGLAVHLGHPDGSFDQTPELFTASSEGIGTFAAGDFNRDGMMDFVGFTEGTETFLNATNRAPCSTSQISPTVTVCAPVENTYLPGPNVRVQANAYDRNQVTAIQLYANGSLETSQNTSTMDQSFPLGDGDFFLVVKAWDYTGLNFRSQRHIHVYSGTPGAVCPAALGAANLCLPGGATSSSPVHIVANGYTPNVPTSAQLYIDGTEVVEDDGCIPSGGCIGGSSAVDTYQVLGAGAHDLVFKLWDADGNVYTAEKSVTVQ